MTTTGIFYQFTICEAYLYQVFTRGTKTSVYYRQDSAYSYLFNADVYEVARTSDSPDEGDRCLRPPSTSWRQRHPNLEIPM